jgi:predicted NBD/HSP70 family sugar kinase
MEQITDLEVLGQNFNSLWDWTRQYNRRLDWNETRTITIRLQRPDGMTHDHQIKVDAECGEDAYTLFERTVKFLLWQVGAPRVFSDAPESFLERIAADYAFGPRAFDSQTIGKAIFGEPISFNGLDPDGTKKLPEQAGSPAGGYTKGCRIGFDLGGSDRKCAAVMDGEVLFSEEVAWDPYHQSDPVYHWRGLLDSIDRAAAHLPRIDAIGGSAAGIYISNEPRVASLFRGIGQEDFNAHIRPIFKRLSEHFGSVPIHVVNDGDATALSAAQSRNLKGVLGIAMGTSMAVGYVDLNGRLKDWINELAFAPIDCSPSAPIDEWSGDRGCGASYFSQQALGHLLADSGLGVDPSLNLPAKLKEVQAALKAGHPGASSIYCAIGTWLAHALLQYRDFYAFSNVLLLGRVLSGQGGELIKKQAKAKLLDLDPGFCANLSFLEPSELEKRHGQAIAAAGLVPDHLIGK